MTLPTKRPINYEQFCETKSEEMVKIFRGIFYLYARQLGTVKTLGLEKSMEHLIKMWDDGWCDITLLKFNETQDDKIVFSFWDTEKCKYVLFEELSDEGYTDFIKYVYAEHECMRECIDGWMKELEEKEAAEEAEEETEYEETEDEET